MWRKSIYRLLLKFRHQVEVRNCMFDVVKGASKLRMEVKLHVAL